MLLDSRTFAQVFLAYVFRGSLFRVREFVFISLLL